jgi:hypothetical protein
MTNFSKVIQAFEIFAKYCPKGLAESNMLGADHDEIYVYVSQNTLDPESEDGKLLKKLGFKPHDGGNWSLSV